MAIDEKQFHQELKTEMKGMQKSSDTTEIKTGEEDDTDDASPKQLIKDDESRAMVTMSRKKKRLYEAMQISKERKKANVDTLEKRKKNLKKNKETSSD
uniref:Pescadillo homolog n=1 Tax=Tanacetum cinerariifolium TaxID=118510 RepID=A0A699Q412_TANCI|nr:pescadillo homolog [Tanacetum cinerariifolium]